MSVSNEEEMMVEIDEVYIEEMCYEFSRLLYDISEEHQRVCNEWEQKYSVLEMKCQEYEIQLSKTYERNVCFISKIKIKLHKWYRAIWWFGKKICINLAQNIFSLGRFLTTWLGIKEKMKHSKLFRKLYTQGLIDKLRK